MKLNYDSVRRDAKKLRAVADDCEAAARTCSKYQNELSQYWQGSAADSYAGALARLNQKNKALARQIEELSAQITAVANEMEEEDRRLAAKIAAKKTAGLTGSSGKTVSKTTGSFGEVSNAVTKAAKAAVEAGRKTGSSTTAGLVTDLVSRLFGKG